MIIKPKDLKLDKGYAKKVYDKQIKIKIRNKLFKKKLRIIIIGFFNQDQKDYLIHTSIKYKDKYTYMDDYKLLRTKEEVATYTTKIINEKLKEITAG